MVALVAQTLLSLCLLSFSPETGDENFDFYLGELIVSELEDNDPMHRLMVDYLVESVFSSNDQSEFSTKVNAIRETSREYPERMLRFRSLDRKLQKAFDEKIKRAQKKRWLYTAGGAVMGAVIGFPIGKAMGGSAPLLWLTIPTGALAGGGAGYLLGKIILMPDYQYETGMINGDVENILDDLDLDEL